MPVHTPLLSLCLLLAAAPPPTTAPTTAPSCFTDKKLGVALTYPPEWRPQPSSDYVLLLTRDKASLSLDVPALPWHIPGMIPMRLVKNGYLDDLRKKVGELKVEEEHPPEIPDANVRLVRSTWQSAGCSFSETALLMIHSDRVYILRATADSAAATETRDAFNTIVQSLHWTK